MRAAPGIGGLSGSAAREVVSLERRVRDVVRVTVPAVEERGVTDALQGRGLHVRRWREAIGHAPRHAIDDYLVGGPRVAVGTPGSKSVLFVARSRSDLPSVDDRALGDDWLVGLLLGYPLCCIEAFCRDSHELVRSYRSWLRDERGPFPYWCNVLAEVFGPVLVSHIPCSAGCAATRVCAERHLDDLRERDPLEAALTIERLRSVMLYDVALGVLSVPATRWSDGGVALDGCRVTSGWRAALGERTELGFASVDGTSCRVLLDRGAVDVRRLDFRGEALP